MKAEELRIGNYAKEITPSSKGVVIVERRHFEDIEEGEIDLFPIPMSEEWAVKWGYECILELCVHMNEHPAYKVRVMVADILELKVHQVQNLFYALTKQELKPE